MEPANADVAVTPTSVPSQRTHRPYRQEHRGVTAVVTGSDPEEFDESHLIRGYD